MRARSLGPTSELLNHLTLQASETKRWLSIGSCFLVRMSMTRTTRHGAGKRSHIERIKDSRLLKPINSYPRRVPLIVFISNRTVRSKCAGRVEAVAQVCAFANSPHSYGSHRIVLRRNLAYLPKMVGSMSGIHLAPVHTAAKRETKEMAKSGGASERKAWPWRKHKGSRTG